MSKEIQNEEKPSRISTYTSKIGDTTFIVRSKFTGTKTLADAFEEIIVSAYRRKYGGPCDTRSSTNTKIQATEQS